jgi:hypothetical protein
MDKTQQYEAVLAHYGVKGQKWGVRRYQNKDGSLTLAGRHRLVRQNKEDEYRKKLTAITSNENLNKSDRKRLEYRNQNLSKRIGDTAINVVTGKLVGAMLTGNLDKYASMDKQQLAKELAAIANTTARDVVLKDALAKSAAKGYTDDGVRIKGENDNRFMTKEDIIEKSVGTVISAAPFLAQAAGAKMYEARAKRAENEAKFKSWGQNILTEKVSGFVSAEYTVMD